jgi:hypothetical protein
VKIHVIHVSQLKKQIPAQADTKDDLSAIPDNPDEQLKSVTVLDKKMVVTGGSATTKLKVQWDVLPPSLATWEEEKDIKRRFPRSTAWGSSYCQREGQCHDLYTKWLMRAITHKWAFLVGPAAWIEWLMWPCNERLYKERCLYTETVKQ